MRATLKITNQIMEKARLDLNRPHEYAYERVGFMFAGVTTVDNENIILLVRDYIAVVDEDYLRDKSAGAVIGPEAMRKGLQHAYKTKSSLLHVHSHFGMGRPEFSSTDIISSEKYVPSFFNAIPHKPHGAIVLSKNMARGLIWAGPHLYPALISNFIEVGSSHKKWE